MSKGGHVIYDGRQIALNYVRGWFLLDLIAALPLEILSLSFMHDGYDLVSSPTRSGQPGQMPAVFFFGNVPRAPHLSNCVRRNSLDA